MANQFIGTGNLGADPEVRFVNHAQGSSSVLNMRIFFDRAVPDNQGGFIDKGGFWLNCSYWHNNAADMAKVLRKGMRVKVDGRLLLQEWKDKETGADRSELVMRVFDMGLALHRVGSVTLKESNAGNQQANQSQANNAGPAQNSEQMTDAQADAMAEAAQWNQEIPF